MDKNKLHIGIIVPQFPSYTETFFHSQVMGLCDRGHKVYVFSSSVNKDAALQKSLQLHKYPNLKVVSLHFNPFDVYTIAKILLHAVFLIRETRFRTGSLRNFLFTSLCKLYLKKYRCDVYHFGYSGVAVSYLPVIDSLDGKIMISCRGTAENIKPVSETGRISKLRKLFEKADKIHCVSDSMVTTIAQYGAPAEKIFVNRPAVDTRYFTRRSDYTFSRRIRILSIGRLVFQKGFVIGVHAMMELHKRFNDFEWTIIGDGPEEEELLFNIHLANLSDHVKLIGKKTRQEILQLYETTDIFFLPSVSEGIANVVLEAMSMKIPVVSSSAGGMNEVITDGVNGLLCENYHYRSMADALYLLAGDFDKRKQLGEKARETIETGFALDRYIDRFEAQYYLLTKRNTLREHLAESTA